MAMRKLLFVCGLLATFNAPAQVLTGVSTKWSDSFREWIIYTDEEGVEGELRQRWAANDDWTEWEYRLGDVNGTIRIKWRDNPNEWELRGGNEIVTLRTRWPNDSREWRIEGKGRFILKSRFGNIRDEWMLENSRLGAFGMVTNWEGDPRDWSIHDDLDESVSLPTRMAMVFTVVFNSVPKW